MPASHDLKGLMKFLAREEWRECFDEVFYDHFEPVLDAGDMEFEDIAEILGDDWAMTLWGCAFEDFLTQDFEVEGGNIVDEYLKRRGWKENAQAKNYMKALRTSVMSLYEVSEIVPGKSLVARDLVRGGDPIAVREGTATRTLKQWDRIAARIVPVMGTNVFAGGLLPFTPQATDVVFDGLLQMFGKKNAKKLPAIKDEELQAAASMLMMAERPAREKEDPASEIPPEIAEQSFTSSWTDNIVKLLISRSACSATRRRVRPQNQPLAGRRSPNGSKYLENQSLRQPDHAAPMATYSFEWMWAELGVSDLRQ